MEPRLLYSADPLATLLSADSTATYAGVYALSKVGEADDLLKLPPSPSDKSHVDQLAEQVAAISPFELTTKASGHTDSENRFGEDSAAILAEKPMRELLIIDQSHPDLQSTLDHLYQSNESHREISVVGLSPTEDPLRAITDILATYHQLDALHIVSQASQSGLMLGNEKVSDDDVMTRSDLVKSWGLSLAAGADIFLYGSDLTSTVSGRQFADRLSEVTTNPVALGVEFNLTVDSGGDGESANSQIPVEAVPSWSVSPEGKSVETAGVSLPTANTAHDPSSVSVDADEHTITTRGLLEGTSSYTSQPHSLSIDYADFALDSVEMFNPAQSLEVIFVDAAVADQDTLLANVQSQTSSTQWLIVKLEDSSSGVQQISNVLSRLDAVDAMHLVTHGADGTIQLGDSLLSASNVEQHISDIQSWGTSLSETADILIYGCDVAATDEGQWLVQQFGTLTGADVAASDDTTGHVDLGGDWFLEYRYGEVNTDIPFDGNAPGSWRSTLPTYTVTNTLSNGSVGSLRWAITQANANVGADTIDFNIAGTGVHTINLSSALPGITDQVVIDATTDDSFAANGNRPAIIVDGNDGALDGLRFTATADNSEVRGLVIRDFGDNAIDVDAGADNITIAGNYLGSFDSSGLEVSGEEIGSAIIFVEGDNVTIGGSSDADRNIIAGGANSIVVDAANGGDILGNYIGTDATGNVTVAITFDGVRLENGTTGFTIGGATSAGGNVIAGVTFDGIQISDEASDGNVIQNNSIGVYANGSDAPGVGGDGIRIYSGADNTQILDNTIARVSDNAIDIEGASSGTIIYGNLIGTDVTGSANWGVGLHGIYVRNGAVNNLIGGIGAGQGNVIANSAQSDSLYDGIGIDASAGTGNAIRGNSIYGSAGLGIDIGADNADANDAGDIDTGANNLQNWAVLNSAAIAVDGTFSYNLDTTILASGTYTIDFYASVDRDLGRVEGERYIGTITGASNGNSALTGTLASITMTTGEFVTLITTDASGNSSEFSTYAMAMDGDSDGVSPEDIKTTATNEGGLSINQDGGNDAYLIADESPFSGQIETTIEVQFSADSAATGTTTLFSYTDPMTQDELFFGIEPDGELIFRTSGGTGTGGNSVTNASNLFDGNQHSVAVTWTNTGGILMFYVDGEQLGLGRNSYQTATTIDAGGTVVIGQHQTLPGSGFESDDTFAGTIHNVRVFDDVRSNVEIAASFRSELPFDEAGLLAQWIFDELSVDGIISDTVSGNNLSINHTSESGFTSSEASLTFVVNENALNGTIAGSLYGLDPQREAEISTLLAANPDLHYSAETGKFYEYVGTGKDSATALADAQTSTLNGVNGNLVAINSATENQIVVDILNIHNGPQAWLAAADEGVEGEWRWYDAGSANEQFWQGDGDGYNVDGAYENWDASNPNDASGQDYAKIFASTGKWDDVDGTSSQKSIIEYDADSVLDATHALTYAVTLQTIAGAFEIDADTGKIRVLDGSLLDADTQAIHTITVEVTDINSNSHNEDFTISLKNLVDDNNAPTHLSSGIELNADGGNDSLLQTSNGSTIIGGLTEFTLETKVSFSDSGNHSLFAYSTTTYNDAVNFQLAGSTLRLSIHDTFIDLAGFDASTIKDGAPHDIAVSWDNTNGDVFVYVDGELVDSATGFATGFSINSDVSNSITLGMDTDAPSGSYQSFQTFRGTHYHFRIWDEVRSQPEIKLNHQNKFDSGSLPNGLIANWQMDGFNGSNEVVDFVSGNNLSIGHATGPGFIASTPVEDLHNSENSADGVSVGFVVPSDPDVSNDIVSDGLFTKAPDPTPFTTYTPGQIFGGWTVAGSGNVYLQNANGTYQDETPLGGNTVHLSAGANRAIEQTLTTEVGKRYQVEFAGSGLWDNPNSKLLRVSVGGQSTDFLYDEAPDNWNFANSIVWEHRSMTFTASDTSTVLNFEDISSQTGQGTLIADIQVVEIPAAVTAILNNDPTLSYDAATDKFYRHVNTPSNFDTAIGIATTSEINGVNGQLLRVDSDYENERFRDLVLSTGNEIWLGAEDDNHDGNWNWLTASTPDDQFWTGGNGGNALTNEYASAMFLSEAADETRIRLLSDGAWGDNSTLSIFAYVVEWDASEVLSNFTFSLTDDAGGRFAIDNNTGEVTVADASLIDYETATTHNVDVQVIDAAGYSYTETMSIAIDNGIEPTQVVPGAQSTNEDTPLVFSFGNGNAVSVSDTVASTNTRLQVFISTNNNGTLTLSQTSGLSIIGGSNGGTFMTIQGTESDINAAFEGMTFDPVSNFAGSVTLNMTTSLGADLTGHYTFESGTVSGSTVSDQSVGLSQNGTLNGDAAIVNDIERGDVLNLDGTGDFVEITGLMGEPADMTLSAWINADSTDSLGAVVISTGSSPALYLNNDGTLIGFYESGGSNNTLQTTESLIGTGWRHVAVSIDATNSNLTLYVDGVAVESSTTIGPIEYDNSPNTYIGRAGDGGLQFDFDGMIDETRIYSRALSGEEIAAIATDNTTSSDSVAIMVVQANDAPRFIQPELISNGDFPTDLSGWTTTGTVDQIVGSMRFGAFDDVGPHTASQIVNTISGASYELSFDYADGVTNLHQSMQVTVDGTSNLLTTSQIVTDVAGNSFVRYTYSFTADADAATVTFTDTSDTAGVSNSTASVDGYVDNISVRFQSGTLSEVTYVEDAAAVVLDANVDIFDQQLSTDDDFGGATLTLERTGAANSEDVFSATGNLNFVGTTTGNIDLTPAGVIGTYVNTAGTLVLTFSAGTTNAQVNEVMQLVAYENSSDSPPASAQIDWTFNDGNLGSQGGGGALEVTASTAVTIQNSADLVITAPATSITVEDTQFVYSGVNVISVDDGIAADTPIRVTLSVANGILSLDDLTGITFVEGADGSGHMVIQGLESDINTALNNLEFTPNANYNGADTLNITTAVAADLVGNYRFEGNADDVSAGATNDGAPSTAGLFAVDPVRGNVLSLNNSEYVEIAGMFGNPADVTMAAWVNVNSGTFADEIISLGDNVALRSIDGANGLTFIIRGTAGWQSVNTNANISDAGWTHVAATVNDTTGDIAIYINGELAATDTAAESIQYTQGTNTRIGENGNSFTHPMDGLIDDARIYTRALSSAEIAALATDQTETSDSVAITVNAVNDAPTFDVGDGIVTTAVGSNYDAGAGTIVLPDGKILIAGTTNSGSGADFALTRYNADGSLDMTFGGGDGIATSGILANNEIANSIAVQADGKILIAGYSNDGSTDDFVVTRYSADGTLDTAFGGGDGIVSTPIGAGDDRGWGVTTQLDGKFVVGGHYFNGTNHDFALTRYNENGTVDSTFGASGIVTTQIGTGQDLAYSVTMQPDGKILLGGSGSTGGQGFALARYNTDGTLDTSFGSGGIVETPSGTVAGTGSSVTLQANGQILLAGSVWDGSRSHFAVLRYDTDGTLDSTFGGTGLVTTTVGSTSDTAESVTVQDDGKVLVAGYSSNGTDNDFALVRYNTNGSLDNTFGSSGIVTTPVGSGSDLAYSVSVSGDGTIVVAGRSDNGADIDFALIKYNSDGSLNQQFGAIANSLDGNPTYVENGAAVVLDADVQVFDQELSEIDDFGGATLTLERTVAANSEDVFSATGNLNFVGTTSGNIDLTPAGVIGTYTNTGGTLVLTFAAGTTNAQVNEVMQLIAYENSSDTPPASTQLDWTFNDGNTASAQGSGGAQNDVDTVQIDITAVNDAPVNAVPGTQTIAEETTTAVSGISIADVDAGAGNLTSRLQVSSGVLNVTLSGAATFSAGANGSGDLTILGSITDINATLASLTYTGNTDVVGTNADTLTVTTDDQGNVGSGGAQNDVDTVQIDITAVNDAPINTVPGTQTIAEETTRAISGISIADADAGAGNLTTRLQVSSGVVNVTLSGAATISAGSNSSNDLTILGSITDINTTLASLTYTGNSDMVGTNADTLTVTTDDQGNVGSGGAQNDVATVQIDITAVNDAPVNTVPGTQSIVEETTTAISGVSIADVDAGAGNLTTRLQVSSGVVNVTLSGAATVSAGSNNFNDVTILGSITDINATLASLTYTGNTDVVGTNADTLTVTTDDQGNVGSGGAQNDVDTVQIDITAVNDAPINTVPGTQTIAEETTRAISGISIADADAGAGNLTTRLQVSSGVVNVTLSGAATISAGSNSSNDLTILGSITDINTTLASLTYTGNSDMVGTNADTLTVTTDDQGNVGSGGAQNDVDTVQIDITAVNDAPVNTVPGTQSIVEETTTAISGVSIADVDAGAGNLTTRLQVSSGVVNVTLSGAATISAGSNSSNDVTILGSITDINTTLASLTYTGNTDVVGTNADTLTVTTDDQGNVGSGGAQNEVDTVQIDITAVNDAPVNTVPGTQTVAEETTTAISGVSIADVDAGVGNLTTRLQVSSGVVNVTLSGAATISVGANGSGDLTVLGSITDINATLASLTYTGNTDVIGTNADTLTVTTDDQGNVGSGGAQNDIDTVQIDITAVNDAPVNTVPGTQTVAEETTTAISAVSIADVDAGAGNLTTRLQVSSGVVNVTLSGAATISAGSNSSNDVTILGSITDINTTLASLTYTGNTDVVGTNADTLTVTTDDQGNVGSGGAQNDVDTVQIDITAVNDVPVNTVPGTQTVAEETTTAISGVSIADVDAGAGNLTTRLQVSSGVVNVTLSGAATISAGANGSGDLTVLGTITDINATLASLTYTGNTDVVGTNADTLTVTTDDQGNVGSGGAQNDVDTVQIDITAGNDAPVNTVPGTQTVAEETTTAISGISIADVDAGAGNLTTRLQVSSGVVNVTLSGAATVSAGSNNSNDVTILGSITDINTTLASLTYTGNTDVVGTNADTLTVTTDDQGNVGSGGAQNDVDTVQIDITAVNDVPVNTVPGTQTVAEETTTAISGVSIADVDAGAGNLTTRLQVSSGVVNVTLSGAATISAGANGSGDLTVLGTITDINATLASLTYTGNTDVVGTNADTLTVTTDDQGNVGSGGAQNDVDTVQIDITAGNDAPVNTVPGTQTVAEETTTAISGISIADVDAGAGNLTTRLQVSSGVVNVTLSGAATVSAGSNNSNDVTILGSITDINTTLASLAYTGNTDVIGTNADTLTVTTDDQGNVGSGGAQNDIDTVQIDITAVNDAPVNTVPGTQTVAEETTTAISGISIADVDAGAGNLTTRLQVSSGVVNVTLSGAATVSAGSNNSNDVTILGSITDINATLASLTYTGNTDVVGTNADTLMVTTDDQGNVGSGGAQNDVDTVQIDITAVNDAPVNTVPGTQTVAEETTTAISGISIADVDAGAGNLTTRLQVSSGVVNVTLSGAATISVGANGSGDLTVLGSITDINATLASLTYTGNTDVIGTNADTLTVTTDDQGNVGSGGAQNDIDTVQIDITAVNDAPVNTVPGTQTVAEETTTAISAVSIADVDAGVGNLTTRLQVSSGVVNVTLSGAATISAGSNSSNDLTILGSITDINTTLASLAYTGNTDVVGTNADTLMVTTDDQGNVGSGGAQNDIDTVQIDITAVNDAPVNTVPGTQTVAEETTTAISGISIADVDAGAGNLTTRLQVSSGVVNVTLSGAATVSAGSNNSNDVTIQGSITDINATLASLTYTGNTDVLGTNADTFTVTTDDQGNIGSGGAQNDVDTVQIDIAAVNDAPVNTVPGTQTIAEETTSSISGISIADIDAGAGNLTTRLQVSSGVVNVTLSGAVTISAGANSSADLTVLGSITDINATLASLTYTGNTDVVGTNADTLTVTTDDQGNVGSGGAQNDVDTVQIDITAVNDAPVNTVPGTQTIAEETTTAISGISIADADAGAGNLTTRLQVSSGVVNVMLSGSATVSTGSNNSNDVTILGSITDINATLSSLTYTGNTDVVGTNADTLTVTTDDQGNVGSGGAQNDVDTVQIDITAVNDAPVNTVPGTQTIAEETTTAISGISIADADAAAGNLTTRLQVSSGVVNVTLSGAATISAGANGSGDLTVLGTITDINATLASLTYTGNTDVVGTNADTLTVTTDDQGNVGSGGAQNDVDTVQIDITAVNDVPVNTVPGTQTVAEETTTVISGISIADVDAGAGNLTTRLQVSSGVVNVTLSGAATISVGANGSGDLTVLGSITDINATLASLTYTGNTDVIGTNADTLTVTTDDQGNVGSGGAQNDVDTVQIDITAVNDAPVNTVPGTQTVAEETTTAISGISIADVDAGAGNLTTRLQVSSGVVNVTLSGAATVSAGSNNSNDVTILGSITDINATLASLTYTGNTDVVGTNADTLMVTTDDQGNVGSGGAQNDVDTVQIDITAVNDAPVNTVPGTQSIVEETTTAISGISIADVDAGAGNLTTRLQVSSGVVNVTLSGSATVSTGSNNSNDVTILGSITDINATLSSLTYTGNTDVVGTNADTLTVTTDDQGNVGSGGAQNDVDTVQIDITAVNDAPVNTVPGTQTIAEETTTAISGISIADADAAAGNLTTRLQVSSGVVNVTLSGAATISAGANGSGDLTVLGTITDINATLASLTYTGNTDVVGTNADTLTVTTDDQGNVGSGGAQNDVDTVQIDITAVNDVPVNTVPGTQTVAEETTTVISGISIADVDAGAGNLTTRLQVSSGVVNVTLSGTATVSAGSNNFNDVTILGSITDINATLASLTYTSNTDVVGTNADTLTVTTDDQGNVGSGGAQNDVDTVQIDLTAVNDDPTNSGSLPSDISVTEDVLSDVDLSTVSFADVDAGVNSLTVTLSTSTGGELSVSGGTGITLGGTVTSRTITGSLTDLNNYFDTASNIQYVHGTLGTTGNDIDTLTVLINDNGNSGSGGGTDQLIGTVNVDVSAVNDAPVNTVPGTQTIAEETTTAISGVSIADVDAGAGNLTTRLQVSSGVVNVTLSGAATISAGVNGSGDLTVLGSITDNNATLASITYTGNTDVVGTNADTLTVTTDDQGNVGSGGAQNDVDTVQIDITAVNDAPVNTVPGTQTIAEETTTAISGVSIADVDAGAGNLTTRLQVSSGVLNMTLSGAATVSAGSNNSNDVTILGSIMDINATLASLTYTGNTDVVGTNADTLTVTTDDQGNVGSGGAQNDVDTVQIDITAVNDAPVNTVPGTQTITEETTTAISGVSIADVDAGAGNLTTRLQVSSGVLNVTLSGAATISAGVNGSGELTVLGSITDINATLASITYTGNTDVVGTNADTLTVTTDDQGNVGSGGAQNDVDTVQIDITAVNDAPVNTVPGTQTIAEETTTAISGVSIADVDAGAGNLTTRLQVSSGVVNVTLSGAATISAGVNGSGDLTVLGSITDINVTLASLTYTGNTDVVGTNADALTVTTDDQGNVGSGGAQNDIDSVQIDITAVNDAPVNTVPGTQTIAEETTTAISGISIADVDAGAGNLTTRLQVSSGVLNVTLSGSATITAGANSSSDLTVLGSISDINATLVSLTYTSNTDVVGLNTGTLTVTTDDLGNTGGSGSQTRVNTVQINITRVFNPETPSLGFAELGSQTNNYFELPSQLSLESMKMLNINESPPAESTFFKPSDPELEETEDILIDETQSATRYTLLELSIDGLPEPMSGFQLQQILREIPLSSSDSNQEAQADEPIIRERIASLFELSPLKLDFTRLVPELFVIENFGFLNSLDKMKKDLDDALQNKPEQKIISDTVVGVSISITAGFMIWLLRGGALLASMFSISPLWKQLDPLPILSKKERGKLKNIEVSTDDVEDIFEKPR